MDENEDKQIDEEKGDTEPTQNERGIGSLEKFKAAMQGFVKVFNDIAQRFSERNEDVMAYQWVFSHERFVLINGNKVLLPYSRKNHDKNVEVLSRGGYTYCYLINPANGTVIVSGMARCSEHDNFCYRIGRQISLGRALKELDRILSQ